MRINLIPDDGTKPTEILEEGFIFDIGLLIFIPDTGKTYEVTKVIFYLVKPTPETQIANMTQNVFVREYGKKQGKKTKE